MAFECPHCFLRNNEVQSASTLADFGIHQTLKISGKVDISRQIVKSEFATIRFEELDFEIPAQKGVLTTVEGLLQCAVEGLQQQQDVRKVVYLDQTIAISGCYGSLLVFVKLGFRSKSV